MAFNFYFHIDGNKRGEIKKILPVIPPPDEIDLFITPFCGSCCVPAMYYAKYKEQIDANPNFKFLTTDVNPNLINSFNYVKENHEFINEEIYRIIGIAENEKEYDMVLIREEINKIENPVLNYILLNKIGRAFGHFSMKKLWKSTNRGFGKVLYESKRYRFIKDFIYNAPHINGHPQVMDYYETMKNIDIDNPRIFVYLDPPYIYTYNETYQADTSNETLEKIHMNMIEMLIKKNIKMMLNVENNPAISLLTMVINLLSPSSNIKTIKYPHKYNGSNRKCDHIILTNF